MNKINLLLTFLIFFGILNQNFVFAQSSAQSTVQSTPPPQSVPQPPAGAPEPLPGLPEPSQVTTPQTIVQPSAPQPTPPAPTTLAQPTPPNLSPRAGQNIVDNRPPFAKYYMMPNRFSRTFLEDGFPLKKEAFMFTELELLRMDDTDAIRNALIREQRRLTKIFFSEHPVFKQYTPEALQGLIVEVSATNEKSLKEANTMMELNGLMFDDFRQHLIRVSSFILYTRHMEFVNPTGVVEPKPPGYIPQTTFDYVALTALLLNLFLFVAFFLRRA